MTLAISSEPAIPKTITMKACRKPLPSKEKRGSRYLAAIVKMGWNIYIGRVLRPTYRTASRVLP